MGQVLTRLSRLAEAVAAVIMAAMFLTFVLQIAIRYSARLEWIAARFPFLEPTHFGWTLEFCLTLWVWLIFWGNAFVVREQDHVTFDIIYNHVRPGIRKCFAIVASVAIAVGLLWSFDPTWDRFHVLRIKKTATLSALFGDWIRMRDIYLIYAVFLIAVALRYIWRAIHVFRNGTDTPMPNSDGRPDE